MSARQLIVLAIAAIAAVGALLLIRGMGRNDAPEAAATSAIAGQQVLVAAPADGPRQLPTCAKCAEQLRAARRAHGGGR